MCFVRIGRWYCSWTEQPEDEASDTPCAFVNTARAINGDFNSDFSKMLHAACTNVVQSFNGQKDVKENPETSRFVINYERRIGEVWWNLKHADIPLKKTRFEAMDVLDALTRHLVNRWLCRRGNHKRCSSSSGSFPVSRG